MKKILIVSLALLAFSFFSTAQLVINEISNSNNFLLTDEDGDNTDWIELYNSSSLPVYLGNYALSDDKDRRLMWRLPALSLDPYQFLIIYASGKDRKPATLSSMHWETAVMGIDSITWKNAASTPPAAWNQVSYAASGWNRGPGGIGYGDGDDGTVTSSPQVSEYLRCTFNILDTAQIQAGFLHLDYDDGFVAYLNGTEIARVGLSGVPPAWNDLAGDHEAQMYAGGYPEPFAIPDVTFNSLKKNGTNVLAIEVHNSSATGDDLSCIPLLSLAVVDGYTYYSPPPGWFGAASAGSNLHTNFTIKPKGEKVYLSQLDGTIVSEYAVPALDINHSIGAVSDGFATTKIFIHPTPGYSNIGPGYWSGYEATPAITTAGGIFPGTVSVGVSNNSVNGGIIRFTINGDDPDSTSAIYTGPISVGSTAYVKARCFGTGASNLLPSKTVSENYLIGVGYTVPVICLTSNNDNFYGPDGVIANPWGDNHKTCRIEYFGTDGKKKFEQFAGMKPDGGAGGSRGNPQTSMHIILDDKIFGDGAIQYPLIPDKSFLTEYHDIYLRNGSNFWNTIPYKEAFMQRLFKNTYDVYNAYTPVVVYVNGQYFGVYELRQKINDQFVATELNADVNDASRLAVSYYYGAGVLRVVDGSDTDYLAMHDSIMALDPADTDFFNKADKKLDVKNFVDYIATYNWEANTDWIWNNMKIINDAGGDKQWKFCLQDLELGYGTWAAYSADMFGYVDGNPGYTYTDIYQHLFLNDSFKNYFTNRFCDLMNTKLMPDKTLAVLNSMHAEIYPEMANEWLKWLDSDPANLPTHYAAFDANRDALIDFQNNRSPFVRDQMNTKFGLGGWVDIGLNVSPADAGRILINTIIPDSLPWTGWYFNGVPIRLTAIANPGFTFDHWNSSPYVADTTKKSWANNITGSGSVFTAYFTGTAITPDVVINEVNYNSTISRDCGNWLELYNNSAQPIDISDWKLKNKAGFTYTISSPRVLAANDYLVLYNNPTKFDNIYQGSLSKIEGNFFFDLDNNGDSLKLFDHRGNLVDLVVYDDTMPWTMGANGTGRTLERNSASTSGALASNWFDGCILGSPTEPYTPCNDPIVFSEINYESDPAYNTQDWVEIRNTTTSSIDISGWRFMGDKDSTIYVIPSGTILAPAANLVIYKNDGYFSFYNPSVTNKIGSFNFDLKEEGQQIRLMNKKGVVQQTVIYDNNSPWATTPDGQAYTLEILDVNGKMNEASNWFPGCVLGSPGKDYVTPCYPEGINETASDALYIYPNPLQNGSDFVIDLPAAINSTFEIQMSNTMGEVVLHETTANHHFSTQGLHSGLYLIRIYTNGKYYQSKLVID